GIACIARRLIWEESRADLIKHEIIDYNQRDCLAVQRIVRFLESIAAAQVQEEPGIVLASGLAPGGFTRVGKGDFAIPELDVINRCARFDYQRGRVLLRTEPGVRASVRRKHAKKRPVRKANVEVQCGPRIACPACGSAALTPFKTHSHSKLVLDL